MNNLLNEINYEDIKNGGNCLLVSYKYILEQYDKDWTYLFATTWSINNIVHSKIHSFVKDYMKFKMEILEKEELEKTIDIIDCVIRYKMNIIIEFNPYYSPWNISYRQVNDIHFCVIIGLDCKNRKVLCIDKFIGNEVYEWDFDLFYEGLNKIYILQNIDDECRFDFKEVYSILLSNFSHGGENILQGYTKLENLFIQAKKPTDLFNCLRGESCYLIIKLKQAQVSRLGISFMLHNMYNTHNNENCLCDVDYYFYELSSLYKVINTLLYRLFITMELDERVIEKIIIKFRELAVKEKKIYSKLRAFLDDNK